MLPAVVKYSAYMLHLFHNNNDRLPNYSNFFNISQSIAYLAGASRTSFSLNL